ncbi:PAS domain S-box protein [Azospirillum sp. A1-3]|uniref:HD domain-containing phosphohydrolase n=1 Tax=Azospirillum sp. A1-3 TaxID=185874 RepID=UPI0020770E68|nr:PAS domain S-box protein [Azospirillum sp. A1-3]
MSDARDTVSPSVLETQLARRSAIAASIIVLLTGLATVVLDGILRDVAADAEFVKLSGRQRMLSQQGTSLAATLAANPEQARRTELAARLEDVAAELSEGQEVLSTSSHLPEEVRALYAVGWLSPGGLVREFVEDLHASAASASALPPANVDTVLKHLHGATSALAAVYGERTRTARVVGLGLLATIAVAAGLTFVLVSRLSARLVRCQMQSLSDTATELAAAKSQAERHAAKARAAEEHLLRLSQAVEQSNNMVLIASTEGIIEYANPRVFEVTGYSREELIGRHTRILGAGETAREVYRALWTTLRAGREWDGELRNRRKDGSLYWVAATISPVRGPDGSVVRYLSIENDITAHKDTAAALHTMRERTRGLVESRLSVIRCLGRAGEYRDNETGMHVARVGQISRLLALALGLGDERAEIILHAAPLHDVGKIGIPDDILLKPGKLTVDEFAVMKTHASIGADILGHGDEEPLRTARIIALTHHEKWDGSGYPNGLRGEAIPIEGRIVAVCDVFDALTSTRPYKTPWSIDDALRLLRENAGTHFDPTVVDAFHRILPAVLDVRGRYADEPVAA